MTKTERAVNYKERLSKRALHVGRTSSDDTRSVEGAFIFLTQSFYKLIKFHSKFGINGARITGSVPHRAFIVLYEAMCKDPKKPPPQCWINARSVWQTLLN